ncbi:hypothetical protein KXQ82_05590 [Mucilaginibacter sp. HMF5004]|uniref:hypothetical protein n=1 Tax=Mucilaginibacter rivuli TaxID=2857527 RepID=UPI001C5F5497|nr:hypothetical protein [Mucilaginibacter rivuli]MBW4889176.1 hypothetical protein [Mucilaginibacter rivuli]
MENMNAILEKLMLNRTALLIKRYDAELKEILDTDLQAYRASHTNTLRNSSDSKRGTNGSRLVA